MILWIKKSLKIICREQGYVKCEKFLVEEHFRTKDEEDDSSLESLDLILAAWKSTQLASVVTLKIKWGHQDTVWSWARAFSVARNLYVLKEFGQSCLFVFFGEWSNSITGFFLPVLLRKKKNFFFLLVMQTLRIFSVNDFLMQQTAVLTIVFMLHFTSLKVKVLVALSCPTPWDTMDCRLPASSAHGILQARIVEWIAFSFSRESSWLRDRTWVSCIAGRFFTYWVTREPPITSLILVYLKTLCFLTTFFQFSLP